MFFGGLGILIGPPIVRKLIILLSKNNIVSLQCIIFLQAGLIVDSTPGRSYWLAFVFATVIQLLAAASTIGCYVLRRTKR